MYGQDELKRRAAAFIPGSRQASAMSFHDRTTDREPHTKAAGLGGEEGVEQPVCILGGDPDAAIGNAQQYSLHLFLTRSDHQFARPIGDRLHCFDTVHHEVDDHLLQLDPIAKNLGQSRRQFRSQRYLVAGQLTLYQRDDLPDDVIDVERYLLNISLVRERADAPDHLAGPDAVVYG